jgi:hypothetical protein
LKPGRLEREIEIEKGKHGMKKISISSLYLQSCPGPDEGD